MIAGWDKTGPALFYVDSDGTRLKGDLFSVGSGSTFAYGVLDQGYHWNLSDEDAQELGRRSIYAAAHRDAFSGNTINVYHVREEGWERFDTVDVNELVRLSSHPPLCARELRHETALRPRVRIPGPSRRGEGRQGDSCDGGLCLNVKCHAILCPSCSEDSLHESSYD